MSQFVPLTPEIVEKTSRGELDYEQIAERLNEYGLSVEKVVHDPSRSIQSTFYADFEHGMYCELYLEKRYLESCSPALRKMALLLREGNIHLKEKEWGSYYTIDVPLAMQAYDFQRRMYDIEPERIFDVWYQIYKRLDYSNGIWLPEAIQYVFCHAPKDFTRPKVDENGMVRLYRGMGELSQRPETAISWSTHPGNALWFANHSGRGTHMVVAYALPEDIVAYFPDFVRENEVLVWPGRVKNIRYEDMFPAKQDDFVRLATPALKDFLFFGRQAGKFGYPKEGWFSFHGINHVLRVLFLSLVYFYSSGDALSEADRDILIYFSLLHDVGRTNETEDPAHGAASVAKIRSNNLRISGLHLNKKEYRIADMLITLHCQDDTTGKFIIENHEGFSRQDRLRIKRLYEICKDMDGLDRVRFNGLDYRFLRTSFARKLPLIAGALLKENLLEVLEEEL